MPTGHAQQLFLEWDARRLELAPSASCLCVGDAAADESSSAALVVPSLRAANGVLLAALAALAALQDAMALAVPMLLRQLLRLFEAQADDGFNNAALSAEPPQAALNAAGGIVACLLVGALANRASALYQPELLSALRCVSSKHASLTSARARDYHVPLSAPLS